MGFIWISRFLNALLPYLFFIAYPIQKQLSDKLETLAVYVCRGSVSRIESGERLVTDMELQAIATILQVRIEALFPPMPPDP